MDELLRKAEVTADRATLMKSGNWACAYHHASDLLHYRAGQRKTLRCLKSYTPNPVEQAVERVLDWDRARDGAE